MFPTPIQKASPFAQTSYKILLPVALFLWLLPLIGVAITSVRPAGDLAAGNYFGIPSGFAGFENYSAVFNNSPIGYYILNSFKVTIPTVIGAVALSCLKDPTLLPLDNNTARFFGRIGSTMPGARKPSTFPCSGWPLPCCCWSSR